MSRAVLIVIIVLLLLVGGLSHRLQKACAERDRLEDNQAALLAEAEYWATENEKSASDVLRLSLTVDELRNSNKRLKETADELNIKLKRIQSASTTATNTEVKVITQVRDSIVYRDSVIVPVKAFTWRDSWTDVNGVISRDSGDLSVSSVDTLTTIVHKVPHKFWFIKWGCKAIKQTVVSSNPHAKITYTEYIELK